MTQAAKINKIKTFIKRKSIWVVLYAIYLAFIMISVQGFYAQEMDNIRTNMDGQYDYTLVFTKDGVSTHYDVTRHNSNLPGIIILTYTTSSNKLEITEITNIKELKIDVQSMFEDEAMKVFKNSHIDMPTLDMDYWLEANDGVFTVEFNIDETNRIELLTFTKFPEPESVTVNNMEWWQTNLNYTTSENGIAISNIPTGKTIVTLNFKANLPVASFTMIPPTKAYVNAEVIFNASTSYDPDGMIEEWQWEFGDGGEDAGETTKHQYTEPGNFTVTLTVQDNDRNLATLEKYITIEYKPDDDYDGDALPDDWEMEKFGNTAQGFNNDPDGDGYINGLEYLTNTDPTDENSFAQDSDNDGLSDLWEWNNFQLLDLNGTDDPDQDGHDNLDEAEHDTDPNDKNDYWEPKGDEEEETNDQFMMIMIIIIVVIIILLLIVLLVFRRRRKPATEDEEWTGEGVELTPGDKAILAGGVEGLASVEGEGEVPGEAEAEDDVVEGWEEAKEVEDELAAPVQEEVSPDSIISETEEPVQPITPEAVEPPQADIPTAVAVPLKPEVTTITKEAKMEIMELGMAHPCSVCSKVMPAGENVFQCTCGLISHKDCMTGMRSCPQCGAEIDLPELKIAAPIAIKKPPMIRKEVKYEVQEKTPPDKAYFVFIPGQTNEQDLKGYVNDYYGTKNFGTLTPSDEIAYVRLFITSKSAEIMLNHCYEQGKEKEVMGLMIGQIFQFKGETYSMVKDVVTSELDATEVNVKFDSFDKLFDQLDNLTYEYQIIGWYHSHPDYSSFMSPTDADTQQRMFKHPYQYAVVIDPIRFDMNAFVFDESQRAKVKEKPFAIIDVEM